MVSATNGVSELAKALAKAQGLFPSIPKNKTTTVKTKTGGQYTYNYADLPSILDLTRKPLSENGLSIAQMTIVHDGAMVLQTRLMHSSGEFIEASYPLPINATAQDMGSAITYARRYSLSPLIGIAPDDDDDGKAAQENDVKPSQPARNFTTDPRQAAKDEKKEKAKLEPVKPDTTKPGAGLASVTVKSIQPIKISGVEASMLKTSGGDFIVDTRKPTARDILKIAQAATESGALVVLDYVTSEKTGNNLVSMIRTEG